MKVQATRRTFYDGLLRRPGSVFVLRASADFNPACMEQVEPSTPERHVSAQDAIRDVEAEQPAGAATTAMEPVNAEDLSTATLDWDPFCD
jgi:hypothetical protein